ncbi:hypothetical protein C0Q70_16287 [Pomacea canaliculata]|uniref:Uncharacterized protein n=1 Tax=Pomacea canaliculata TaxID=400727 RepID=A0A2T7NPE4_POMCA|nr:hypothetical protein C0Q70_16287 [Pomacea canaliculata]
MEGLARASSLKQRRVMRVQRFVQREENVHVLQGASEDSVVTSATPGVESGQCQGLSLQAVSVTRHRSLSSSIMEVRSDSSGSSTTTTTTAVCRSSPVSPLPPVSPPAAGAFRRVHRPSFLGGLSRARSFRREREMAGRDARVDGLSTCVCAMSCCRAEKWCGRVGG